MGSPIQENQLRASSICQSMDHSIHYCPQAICAGCRNYGHTKKVCPNNNFTVPYTQYLRNQQRACSICQSMDHSIHHCPHAICRGCRNYGHTMKVCPSNNFTVPHPARIFRIRYQNRSTENNNEFRRTVENMREFQEENSNETMRISRIRAPPLVQRPERTVGRSWYRRD